MSRLQALSFVAAALWAGNAFGHHGIANFDLNKDLTISGTVTKLAFVNPHSWLYVSVAGPDGRATEWQCEMRAATVLRRSGWGEDMFKAGTPVTILGSPDRQEPNTCYLGTVTFADGSSMDRYGQMQKAPVAVAAERPERLPNGDLNFAGDWAGEQRVMTDRRGISGALGPISVAERLAPGAVPEGGRAFPGARGTPESLAENAIVHALSLRTTPGCLSVRAAADGAALMVEIGDDGGRGSPGVHHGHGLATLRARLAHLYGEGDWLVLEPNPTGGTTARLRLPASCMDAGGAA